MNHSDRLAARLLHAEYHTSDNRIKGAVGSFGTNRIKKARIAKSGRADGAVFRAGVDTGSIDRWCDCKVT
jgi:hypothetical protein